MKRLILPLSLIACSELVYGQTNILSMPRIETVEIAPGQWSNVIVSNITVSSSNFVYQDSRGVKYTNHFMAWEIPFAPQYGDYYVLTNVPITELGTEYATVISSFGETTLRFNKKKTNCPPNPYGDCIDYNFAQACSTNFVLTSTNIPVVTKDSNNLYTINFKKP